MLLEASYHHRFFPWSEQIGHFGVNHPVAGVSKLNCVPAIVPWQQHFYDRWTVAFFFSLWIRLARLLKRVNAPHRVRRLCEMWFNIERRRQMTLEDTASLERTLQRSRVLKTASEVGNSGHSPVITTGEARPPFHARCSVAAIDSP